jgi:hypothetical protein
LFGGAIYYTTALDFGDYIDSTSIWVLGGVGLIMMLISGFGCCAAYKDSNKWLRIYACLLLVVFAIQIAGAYLVGVYINRLDSAANGPASSGIEGSVGESINNAVLSAYVRCCTGCMDIGDELDVDVPGNCDNGDLIDGSGLSDLGERFLIGSGNEDPTFEGNCADNGGIDCFVGRCAQEAGAGSELNCFVWTGGDNAKNAIEVPTNSLSDALCDYLADRDNKDGNALVGPMSDGSCGGGNATQFRIEVNKYAEGMFAWFFAFAIFAAVVQFFLFFATLWASCTDKDSRRKK